MPRRLTLALMLACACAAPAIGQVALLASALPSPTDVVGVIDYLTRKDSETTVDVKFGKTSGQGKLLVARTRVDVTMERLSRNWRGRVVVGMTVPSDVSYAVDLSSLRAEHIRPDEKNKRLIIAMPTPAVEDVTPLLTEVKIDPTFKRARFGRIDADTSRELQNVMLREDYLGKARMEAAKHLPRVRDEARAVLEEFLQRLLAGQFPGLKVVVE